MKKLCSVLAALLVSLSIFLPVSAEAAEFKIEREAVLSALYEADIAELREAVTSGLVSCEELTDYYLDRIEKYNKEYNCFITLCEDAKEEAQKRDFQLAEGKSEGLLFGVPVVIKDNIDLSSYVTTNGKLSAKKLAKSDAEVVKSLLREGAVIIGKTNMSTSALYAKHSESEVAGDTHNAYNTELSPGGSSGGTATAVSLNFAAAGLGTDTSASLRYPAVLGGCVAMRTTFGLVSTDGIKSLDETRDVAGAITRSVYDQAVMLDVLTGGEYSYTENLNANRLSGLKIGVISELSYPTNKETGRKEKNCDSEVANAFSKAVSNLRSAGAEVEILSFSKVFTLSDKTFNQNNANKEKLYNAFCKFLDENGLDAAIFPTYLSTPLKLSNLSADYVNNCKIISPSASSPEIAITIGYHSTGAGIGMEIAAKKGEEQLLLDIAYSYTENFGCRKAPTGAPDDYAEANEGTLTEIFAAREEFLTAQAQKEEASASGDGSSAQDYLGWIIAALLVADLVAVSVVVLLIILYKRQ